MTVYLLRHEKRFPIPTYFTSLTDEGLENSKLLCEEINTIQPDIILTSPFLRCIQTIYPYAKKYNKKINIDYSLYEFLEDPLFTKNNYKQVKNDDLLIYMRHSCKLDPKTNRCNRKPRFQGNKSACKISPKKRCMKIK